MPDARGDTSVEVPGMLVEQEATVFAFGRPGPFRVRTLVTKRWRLSFSDDPGVCELYDWNDRMRYGIAGTIWTVRRSAQLSNCWPRS